MAFFRVAFEFPFEKIDLNFLMMGCLVVGFSIYLKIQLPQNESHLSFADGFTFLAFWLYGGKIAVLLSATEALYSSFQVERRKKTIDSELVLFNFSNAALSTFITVTVCEYFFGHAEYIAKEGKLNTFIAFTVLMVIIQFLCNSIISAVIISDKTKSSVWTVWNEFFLTTLVVYIAQAAIAGSILKVIQQIDAILFMVTMAISGIVYASYKHYVNEIRQKSLFAEQAERERAEQALKHIEVLNTHIAEQSKISDALRQSKEQFQYAAYHDELTNLPNRNLFSEKLNLLVERAKEDSRFSFAVLYLDLNRFKNINDSLGHSFGDKLLELITKRLGKTMREGDILSRFSGDEFAIILHGVLSVKEVEKFAERLQKKIKTPFSLNGRKVYTSASIGIALSSIEYESAENMLRDADIAMFYAKEHRTDYAFFDNSMHSKAFQLLELETDLRLAVERNEFVIYYQPIVKLDSGKLAGFEALMRWNHPHKGLVPPSEFIPLSEETGLIIPMTIWLLKETCRQVKEWENLEQTPLMLSANLSSHHFTEPDLANHVKQILQETNFEPHRLKLEITESAVMENAEQTIEILKQLKEIGVQLSIDDFGTGYSSLSYLHRFPINTLKIDRSFVSAMSEAPENKGIIQTIVSLAKNLELDVVAEGIETLEQYQHLKYLRCEYGQGFLFSRPIPKEAVENLLESKKDWSELLPDFSIIMTDQPIAGQRPYQLRLAR